MQKVRLQHLSSMTETEDSAAHLDSHRSLNFTWEGSRSRSIGSAYNWAELQRMATASSVVSDSVVSGATLVIDGTRLSPQQLGLMGLEAMETVVSYWEDALSAYHPPAAAGDKRASLPSPEEAEFTRKLENILEGAYLLQEEAEHMFIHQHSILNKRQRFDPQSGPGPFDDALDAGRPDQSSAALFGSFHNLLSVSTVDQDSFVSAQDTIADLRDFEEDLELLSGETLSAWMCPGPLFSEEAFPGHFDRSNRSVDRFIGQDQSRNCI